MTVEEIDTLAKDYRSRRISFEKLSENIKEMTEEEQLKFKDALTAEYERLEGNYFAR